ncbi:MAG: S8 family peptidase [Candidatus Bathyarchaeota archaeon]|nr:S8 family peptidase [Candidatus Bathyarchaeota archaeon]
MRHLILKIILVILVLAFSAFSNAEGFKTPSLPNDPDLPKQWGWFAIEADKSYTSKYTSSYRGEGIVIAVLDTGIDHNHPDLKDNIIKGWNFVDGNDNTTDLDGHGTHVSGIIAATVNNGIGIAGIAPKAKIMPLKVISERGGSWLDLDGAIRYATANGAKIISMSLGGKMSPAFTLSTSLTIKTAYYNNVTIIAAAGNEGTSSKLYPAAYSNVISVSAIDKEHNKAEFSNYGRHITFSAPGVNIYSTMPTYPVFLTTEYNYSQNYDYLNGTSMACPFVTGIAALLLSKYPDLTPEMVKDTMIAQAFDLGGYGFDPYFGHGLPNAYKAITGMPIPEFEAFDISIFATIVVLIILFSTRARIVKKVSYSPIIHTCKTRFMPI